MHLKFRATESITSFEHFLNVTGSEQAQVDDSILILYRGQEQNWDLLPKIARYGFFKDNFLEYEQLVMKEFERLSHPYLTNSSDLSLWDKLAIAQHHRLPTRLLDWSENPLVALWFSFATERKEPSDSSARVVWSLHINESEVVDGVKGNPYSKSSTAVFRPKHTTRTITAQSGWFTLHAFVRDESTFIPLNKNKVYRKRLMCYTFTEGLRSGILERLNRLGVNHLSMFPDLSGLCDYLQWKHFTRDQRPNILSPLSSQSSS